MSDLVVTIFHYIGPIQVLPPHFSLPELMLLISFADDTPRSHHVCNSYDLADSPDDGSLGEGPLLQHIWEIH